MSLARVGVDDRMQFATSRIDSGWTNRRELRWTPTRRGENHLRAQAEERSMLRTPSPRRATAVDTTSANSVASWKVRSRNPPFGAFPLPWRGIRPNSSLLLTATAKPLELQALLHKSFKTRFKIKVPKNVKMCDRWESKSAARFRPPPLPLPHASVTLPPWHWFPISPQPNASGAKVILERAQFLLFTWGVGNTWRRWPSVAGR